MSTQTCTSMGSGHASQPGVLTPLAAGHAHPGLCVRLGDGPSRGAAGRLVCHPGARSDAHKNKCIMTFGQSSSGSVLAPASALTASTALTKPQHLRGVNSPVASFCGMHVPQSEVAGGRRVKLLAWALFQTAVLGNWLRATNIPLLRRVLSPPRGLLSRAHLVPPPPCSGQGPSSSLRRTAG